jgi:hypothetical protein
MSLEDELHAELIHSTRESKRLGYNPTYFLQMLGEHGAVATAQRLLVGETPSEGFYTLAQKSRLDLTLEASVVKAKFRELFTDEELHVASARLKVGREAAGQ